MSSSVKPNRRPLDWGWVVGVPFALFGLFMVGFALVWLVRGQFETVAVAGMAGLALVFGAIGALWLVKSYRANRYTLARNRLARAFPAEPWRWRPEWDAGRIVRASRRFGEVVLELHTLPAPLGGDLRGTIRTHLSALPVAGFELHLSAVHFRVTGVGQGTRIEQDVLWETTRTVTAARTEGGVHVEFALPIPGDLPETNDNHPNNEIQWRLRVTGDIDGRRFRFQFDVPVFSLS